MQLIRTWMGSTFLYINGNGVHEIESPSLLGQFDSTFTTKVLKL